MSGIYIKDMEMPTRQVLAVINPDGLVEILNNDNILIEEFQAIQVPPHGRLIDADALAKNVTGAIYHSELRAAPTIIPAAEE